MNLTNINEVKELLGRHGFHFSKSLGQNFLIASWVPEDIAASALLDENTGVLEVGAGIGCLTEQLSMRAGKVVCVELDNSLRPVLAETLKGRDNVEIVYGDIMKQDIPALVKEKFGDMRCVVCANLPYNITSPVLTAFIESKCFDAVTVMIQREVAKRICAKPGNADYGAFSLFVQWYMETELLFDVPASCFVPQPKVTSAVIRLKKREKPQGEVKDEELMFKIIRAAFNQRRKTLVNAISAGVNGVSKEEAEQAIVESGLDARVRGEALGIEDFIKIADKLHRD